MKKTILTLAAFAAFLGLAATPAPVSAKASTTKTVTRKIKVYRPSHYTTVKQVAVLKKRGKKWSKATWKAYKAPTQSGYKASTSTVKAAKVTSKTKNKTVKITYKAIKKTKKTAVKATSTDSRLQLRQAALSVVNSFRAKAGVKAVRLNSKYNAVLDKRATAKAKQYVTTGTYDHSGYESLPTYLNTYPIVKGRFTTTAVKLFTLATTTLILATPLAQWHPQSRALSLKTCKTKRMTTKPSLLRRPERTSPTSAGLTNTTP